MKYSKEKEFYVYVYLDPRKPGRYLYGDQQVTYLFEPFYVGKGKNNRLNEHLDCLKKTKDKKRSYKSNKIR